MRARSRRAAGREAAREGLGLGEADADALAGERVHIARSVADEEHAAVDPAADVLAHRSRAADLAGRRRVAEPVAQRGEFGQPGPEAAARLASRAIDRRGRLGECLVTTRLVATRRIAARLVPVHALRPGLANSRPMPTTSADTGVTYASERGAQCTSTSQSTGRRGSAGAARSGAPRGAAPGRVPSRAPRRASGGLPAGVSRSSTRRTVECSPSAPTR